MKTLDDNLNIGLIKAIPKTHNSCAVDPLKKSLIVPWLWAKCQKYDISHQLNIGVRGFIFSSILSIFPTQKKFNKFNLIINIRKKIKTNL